jgi:hypothetical protein
MAGSTGVAVFRQWVRHQHLVPTFRHRPARPGDPVGAKNWVTRMKRVMTKMGMKRLNPSTTGDRFP